MKRHFAKASKTALEPLMNIDCSTPLCGLTSPLDQICILLILAIIKKGGELTLSSKIKHIFATMLGIINDESFLIRKINENGLVKHQGEYEKTGVYKNLSLTEKGEQYLIKHLENVIIPTEMFNETHRERILKVLTF
ncbi:MAG: hypothetical protein Q4B43_08765 [Bacteroidota bacterium]|nr:hypothetical protein [Bacteroidota bacterium]